MSDQKKYRMICIEISGADETALQATAENLGEILETATKSHEASFPEGIEFEEMEILDPESDEEGEETDGAGV